MADFDVFNGDADGIFSLIQLRRTEPRDGALITGVKRDIALLSRIEASVSAGDRVTALDISMARNASALSAILDAGAQVDYFDHHRTGDISDHANLAAHIDLDPLACTSSIVADHLGAVSDWAVCGAFGDNLQTTAARLAEGTRWPMDALRELGELINYNAYGHSLADLHFDPAELYRRLSAYESARDVLAHRPDFLEHLRTARVHDWRIAARAEILSNDHVHALRLPVGAAANRISGLLANQLVERDPGRTHVILTGEDAALRISLRGPRQPDAADMGAIAARFGGGGRRGAAGIDALDAAQIPDLLSTLRNPPSPPKSNA